METIHDPKNEETPKSYNELISTLPKIKGWTCYTRGDLYQYQGFWFFDWFLNGVMKVQNEFKAQPCDIILCSAPKTGTTWLKSLTFAIVTRKSFDDSTNPLLFNLPHTCVLRLEDQPDPASITRDPKMPLLSTHIPFSSLPQSLLDSGCKIVYICRDLKDAFVSLYHFLNKLWMEQGVEIKPLEDVFELFCEGKCIMGPPWDHVLGYWKASLERPDKVLFLKYEDLKENAAFYVKKMAEFMGYSFSAKEEEDGAVERIVKLCSFENLSNLEVNKRGTSSLPFEHENKYYFRKGKVGDWKNYLTPEMGARLDRIVEQKKLEMYGGVSL